jgi:hypothetical protein
LRYNTVARKNAFINEKGGKDDRKNESLKLCTPDSRKLGALAVKPSWPSLISIILRPGILSTDLILPSSFGNQSIDGISGIR